MDPSLRTAASGMIAQQRRVDVIAHNLANVNTHGYKRSRAHFEDLLYQTVQDASTVGEAQAETMPAVQIGRGTRLTAVQRIDEQGPIQSTGRPLDIAIDGDGYFQVQLPDGRMAYTRDGSFSISDRGMLVTSSGYAVVPEVVVPPDTAQLSISRNGVVTATSAHDGGTFELGRIELARFTNSPGLRAMGENLYTETPASGDPVLGFAQEDGFGRLIQGSLESSNVEIVNEMVDMIGALRAYEINSKAVRTSEEMAQIANGIVR